MSTLQGDPAEPFLYLATKATRLPAIVRRLLVWFAGSIMGDEQAARIIAANCGKTVNELQTWVHRRYAPGLDLSYSVSLRRTDRPVDPPLQR